jgi:hypothetical protein
MNHMLTVEEIGRPFKGSAAGKTGKTKIARRHTPLMATDKPAGRKAVSRVQHGGKPGDGKTIAFNASV